MWKDDFFSLVVYSFLGMEGKDSVFFFLIEKDCGWGIVKLAGRLVVFFWCIFIGDRVFGEG